MIKKLFSGQINSITLAALLVALSSLVSRILGIFRDRILAGEFGAGDMLDSYYAAFRFPDLIFNLLVLGALSAGFIPIFTQLVKKFDLKEVFIAKKNNEAWILVNNVINSLGIILIVLAIIGFIFSPELMKLTVPKFSPEKQAIAAMLSRIMFLSPFFLGLSSVIGGVLQSFKRFFVYSLSPIFYNVGIIIGAAEKIPVIVGGGTQMAAVIAAAIALEPSIVGRIIHGTTRWLVKDPNSNVTKLISDISSDVPLVYINMDYSDSPHEGLQAYEWGFIKEGVLRQGVYKNGRYLDIIVMSVLHSEWKGL